MARACCLHSYSIQVACGQMVRTMDNIYNRSLYIIYVQT